MITANKPSYSVSISTTCKETYDVLQAFIGEGVDAAVLEVGLGGRYDCTNVVSQPVCTAVTTLALG